MVKQQQRVPFFSWNAEPPDALCNYSVFRTGWKWWFYFSMVKIWFVIIQLIANHFKVQVCLGFQAGFVRENPVENEKHMEPKVMISHGGGWFRFVPFEKDIFIFQPIVFGGVLVTWRIIPLSKWLGSPPFLRHSGKKCHHRKLIYFHGWYCWWKKSG